MKIEKLFVAVLALGLLAVAASAEDTLESQSSAIDSSIVSASRNLSTLVAKRSEQAPRLGKSPDGKSCDGDWASDGEGGKYWKCTVGSSVSCESSHTEGTPSDDGGVHSVCDKANPPGGFAPADGRRRHNTSDVEAP